MVKPQPSKLMMRVRFPPPAYFVSTLIICPHSSAVEHFLGKEEVTGSSPVVGSRVMSVLKGVVAFVGVVVSWLIGSMS